MPRPVVQMSVEVPAVSNQRRRVSFNAEDDETAQDSAGRQASAMRSSSRERRSTRRYSPYQRQEDAVPAAPTTLGLSGPMELMLNIDGPISSRTRRQRSGFKGMRKGEAAAMAVVATASADGLAPVIAPVAPPTSGARSEPAASSSSSNPFAAVGFPLNASAGPMVGPLLRQQEKEDKWRQKLQRQSTWWDQANLALEEACRKTRDAARRADSHLDEAVREAEKAHLDGKGALRTLMRGRNHAKAEVRKVDAWREEQFDKFLGAGTSRDPAPEAPPKHSAPSPNHFERRYSTRRPLPPIKRATRDRIASQADASRSREAKNNAARAACLRGNA